MEKRAGQVGPAVARAVILKSETYNFHRLDFIRQAGFIVTIQHDEDGLRLVATMNTCRNLRGSAAPRPLIRWHFTSARLRSYKKGKDRLAAFSDGVIAIIITIMVLELKVPHGADWIVLIGVLPKFISYVLSFIYLAIYWNNHHHLLHTVTRVDGLILWANSYLLFWPSLIPAATAWMGENPLAPVPTAVYGVILLMPAIAYYLLQKAIIQKQGEHSMLASALGADVKGKLSPILYVAGITLAFVSSWLSILIYVLVAVIWLIPDRRIENALRET